MSPDEETEIRLAMAAEQALSAAYFGPIPDFLAGMPVHYHDTNNEDLNREYAAYEGRHAYVTAFERPDGSFTIELTTEGASVTHTPDSARQAAAEILEAVEVYERLSAQIEREVR